ncbi:MAG: diaminopimelate epimerase [Acidobacteriota bacterium]
MRTLPFCKFHGFGNDYIVIERDDIPADLSLEQLAREMCHRHTGAGSDGIAALGRPSDGDSDYDCEIINPDGSIAEFSGNGTRCAAAYLYFKSLWSKPELRLRTRSGIKNFSLIERIGNEAFWFDAEIGKPQFSSDKVPVLVGGFRVAVVNEPINLDGRLYAVSAVNIGNPVACIFVDELDFDWRSLGRALEHHEKFPQRVNAVIVKILDRENIEIRIWERGAGETSASGSCASGAAVLSAFMLKTERKVNVHSPGGVTKVNWRKDDQIVLTGRADLAYSGEWPIK